MKSMTPHGITELERVKNNKAKFKEVLRKYLNKHFLYAVDKFFMIKDLC
jgi:hypothetical protein